MYLMQPYPWTPLRIKPNFSSSLGELRKNDKPDSFRISTTFNIANVFYIKSWGITNTNEEISIEYKAESIIF